MVTELRFTLLPTTSPFGYSPPQAPPLSGENNLPRGGELSYFPNSSFLVLHSSFRGCAPINYHLIPYSYLFVVLTNRKKKAARLLRSFAKGRRNNGIHPKRRRSLRAGYVVQVEEQQACRLTGIVFIQWDETVFQVERNSIGVCVYSQKTASRLIVGYEISYFLPFSNHFITMS